MKTINNIGAQGDILFRRLPALPKGATKVRRSGPLVLAHSETGHNHECEDADAWLYDIGDDLVTVLEVAGDHADIVHRRAWDTHEPVRLGRGTWEVRRQREYTPHGWRRVED